MRPLPEFADTASIAALGRWHFSGASSVSPNSAAGISQERVRSARCGADGPSEAEPVVTPCIRRAHPDPDASCGGLDPRRDAQKTKPQRVEAHRAQWSASAASQLMQQLVRDAEEHEPQLVGRECAAGEAVAL